jgi:hypothetical protein
MREFGRSGVGRCTASPYDRSGSARLTPRRDPERSPLARATAARRGRPGAATVRAFLARQAAGEGGPPPREPSAEADLLAELRRGIPARREPGRVPRAPRPGRRPRPERAPVPLRSGPVVSRTWMRREAGRPHPGADTGSNPRHPVRLTRRGRAVVLGLVLLLGALVGFLAASPGQAADPPKPAVTAVVQPGDTLWSFAERNLPRWHTIAAVAELQRLNHLEGSVIHPGQRLVLPARR